ncbi:hypothetical protein HPP92_000911 [Vanilla planifolia]|uniref:PB1 domain-containing protein n=1 Tax=Vanilla planifolia TaxID=51239 RepID=A0A835RPR4_VANPL|nr:hypothetical protein HPP92_000911 [Vanilla planifolia]
MAPELDVDSISSTPRSDHLVPPPKWWNQEDFSATAGMPHVRLMCSFGGRILPRPHDHQLRYVGGDTRIVAVPRSASFSTLLSKLSKIPGALSAFSSDQFSIKYQLPNEDLDALISLTSDEDVENMMEEYDRISISVPAAASHRTPRLRLFLFLTDSASVSDGCGFGSVLNGAGGSKSEDWFFDALNGTGAGSSAPPSLMRGRSEVSSILSEVPDYLFGFDNNSDEPLVDGTMSKGRPANDNLSYSEPGSPAPAAVCRSGSSTPLAIAITDQPAVGTKPEDEFVVHQQSSYAQKPVWQYVAEPAPIYYFPGPIVPGGSLPVQSVPMPFPYSHQAVGGAAGIGCGQPVMGVMSNTAHGGSVYAGEAPVVATPYKYTVPAKPFPPETYDMMASGGLMRNPVVIPIYQPSGFAAAVGEQPLQPGLDVRTVEGYTMK